MFAVMMDVLEEAGRMLDCLVVAGVAIGALLLFLPGWVFGGSEIMRWMSVSPSGDFDPASYDVREAA